MPSGNPLFATKSVDQLRSDAEGSHGLKRTLPNGIKNAHEPIMIGNAVV